MQKLPYVVVTNPHISYVYQLYCEAFDSFRKIKEVHTQEDNDQFCAVLKQALQRHLTVIPKLVMGVLECRDLMSAEQLDKFMNTLLRSVRQRTFLSDSCAHLLVENIAASNCRTTPRSDRHIQLAVSFSRLEPRAWQRPPRFRRRSIFAMQCEGSCRILRKAHPEACSKGIWRRRPSPRNHHRRTSGHHFPLYTESLGVHDW